MKKKILLAFMLIPFISKAQHAALVNDTITYNNFKIAVGDTLHLGYGSDSKKDFVFVQIGSGMSGLSKLDANYSRQDVVINKVYKQTGKIYARGVMVANKALNMMGAGKIFIDVEGAIDNKELITPIVL